MQITLDGKETDEEQANYSFSEVRYGKHELVAKSEWYGDYSAPIELKNDVQHDLSLQRISNLEIELKNTYTTDLINTPMEITLKDDSGIVMETVEISNGKHIFTGLIPAEYLVTIEGQNYKSIIDEKVNVEHRANGVNFNLVGLGTILGEIFDQETNEKITAPVSITVSGDGLEETAEFSGGEYEFNNLPHGNYKINFESSSYESGSKDPVLVEVGKSTEQNLELFAKDAELTIYLREKGSDSTISQVKYRINEGEELFLADGGKLVLRPGEYSLTMWYNFHREITEEITLAPAEKRELTLEFDPWGLVKARVTDRGNIHISGATVTLNKDDIELIGEERDNAYYFEDLDLGTYVLAVDAEWWTYDEPSGSIEIEVLKGELDKQIRLHELGNLRGTIKSEDEYFTSLSPKVVFANIEGEVDSAGNFLVEGIKTGSYFSDLIVTADGHKKFIGNFVLIQGENQLTEDIILPREKNRLQLEVREGDELGSYLKLKTINYVLSNRDNDRKYSGGVSDANNGIYQINDVMTGHYDLEIKIDGYQVSTLENIEIVIGDSAVIKTIVVEPKSD